MGGWFSCGLVLGGSVGKDLFVDDERFHFAADVAALVVVAVDEPRYLADKGFANIRPCNFRPADLGDISLTGDVMIVVLLSSMPD
ncbi:MAG: hypothetical protein BMS9Abin12_1539 [Acidimicrobiia bacterium]|nr:MAG: hypothetical protein BMS9Abin12_1539 [Acidimicrobiia bacterium]